MFAILLVSLVAACAAAPHYGHHGGHSHFYPGPPPFRPEQQLDPGFAPRPRYSLFNNDNNIFDTRQFWSQMANELRHLDDILVQFNEKFPSISSTQGTEGNQYKITIPLNGFQEDDIVVKAREGLLMVQAVHKLEGGMNGETSYLDIKTLPSCVNVTGSWTYEDNVLKIMFPLKPGVETEGVTELVTEEPVTEGHSREEMAPSSNVDGDADVGARGDDNYHNELFTNEIPRNNVEATTYAVDLKDEVEFVPVRYR